MIRRLFFSLLALGALLIAVVGVAGTFAFTSDQAASGGNTVGTATFALGGTADGAPLLADDLTMRPGQQAREGTTVLRNDGSVPGDLYARLSTSGTTSPALLDALRVQLLLCADDACAMSTRVAPPVGDAHDWVALSALASRIHLGELLPGQAVRYRTRLIWPKSQDDAALYGASIGDVTLRWSLRTPSPEEGG